MQRSPVDGERPLVEQVAQQPRQPVEPGGPRRSDGGLPEESLRQVERQQRHAYFLPALDLSPGPPSLESAAMKASWGTSTRPTIFIRFLPSFCFSRSLRLRVMSPP